MKPAQLREFASRWSNIDKDQLVSAGVIGEGVGGSDWSRFNVDPMMFIMKLPHDRLHALCELLNESRKGPSAGRRRGKSQTR